MKPNKTGAGVQAQELMIGNYLHDREGRLCKVERLGEDGEIYAPAIKGAVTALGHSPIELTEKWLKNFGFTTKEDCEGLYKGDMIYYNGFISFGQTIKITYVHQLQNLYFALTHTKLTR